MAAGATLGRLPAAALFLAVQAAAVGLVAAAHRLEPADPILRVQFVVADDAAPPPPGAGWRTVALPHEWRLDAAHGAAQAWYRFEVTPPAAPGAPQALLLWQVGQSVEVFFNGAALGGEEVASGWRPVLVPVPPSRWRPGANEVALHLRSSPDGPGYLGKIYVGPETAVAPPYALRHFLKVELLLLGSVTMLVLGSAMAVLGWWRDGSNIYLLFGLAAICWANSTLIFTVPGVQRLGPLVDWTYANLIVGFVASMTLFMHRYLDLRRERLERYALRLAAAMAALLLALSLAWPPGFYGLVRGAWMPVVVASYAYPVALIVRRFWRRPDEGGYWLMHASAVTLPLGVYDLSIYSDFGSPLQGFWSDYSAPYIVVAFGFILLRRFHLALRESESLNRELARRVQDKQREIEQSYQALRASERRRLLAEERERIQRDMHDGLGGTLVSALAGLELKGEEGSTAAQLLRSALDDLRLMLYSLDPDGGTLRAALGSLRERLARLAEDAGLALDWRMAELSPALALERGVTLQLMRIVQEAFANAVKHARASTFRLEAQARDGRLVLEMRDDGIGLGADASHRGGHGLTNMQQRAQKIGAQLEILAAAPGTCLRLGLPLATAAVGAGADHMNS